MVSYSSRSSIRTVPSRATYTARKISWGSRRSLGAQHQRGHMRPPDRLGLGCHREQPREQRQSRRLLERAIRVLLLQRWFIIFALVVPVQHVGPMHQQSDSRHRSPRARAPHPSSGFFTAAPALDLSAPTGGHITNRTFLANRFCAMAGGPNNSGKLCKTK